MTFARKINKIPEIYLIFSPKMPEFYMTIAEKYFPDLGGDTLPLPPSPRLWHT